MFRYYLLLAWRIMKRQKVYTAINILGLAIGVCACLVIYLVTTYDLSFDRFHKDKNRIFRITGEVQRLNGETEFANSVIPDVAGIETIQVMRYAARVMDLQQQLGFEPPLKKFLEIMAEAKSNDPKKGTGADLFVGAALRGRPRVEV